MSGFGDTRYIIDIMILRAHGIYSIWRNMAHVGLKDRFELPHSFARLFNVVKILGSAVTAVRSVVNIVYDFKPKLKMCPNEYIVVYRNRVVD